jgi:hypothetical protein
MITNKSAQTLDDEGPPPGALITRPISARRGSASPVATIPTKKAETASPSPSSLVLGTKPKPSYSVQIPRKLEKLTDSKGSTPKTM